jgi:hypothetical protein
MSLTRTCRFALLAAIAALVPLNAAAQTRSATPVRVASYPWTVGVTAGLTLSTIDAEDDTDLHNIWGVAAGVFATRSLNRNVGVQIEALVSQRGAKLPVDGPTLRLTYLDVPLLVRVGNTTTNRTHFHAFAGLAPGFKLNAKLSDNAVRLTPTITKDIKTFDLGLPIGVEVERGAWSFDARYTFGLTDINDVPGGVEIKNRSAMFKVSYRMR